MYTLMNFFAVVWYYFSYSFLQSNLGTSNGVFLITGASIGSFFSGVILDLCHNRKTRIFFYVMNLLCSLLLYHMTSVWSKYLHYGFFFFGVSFAIGITDFIKYICETYPKNLSLLLNAVSAVVTLIIILISFYVSSLSGKFLSQYLILHSIITLLSVIGVVFFSNDKKEKTPEISIANTVNYFSEALEILQDKKLIFYFLFLIVNTMSVVAGSVFFVYQKNILFLKLGIVFTCLLYYFILPKLQMEWVTIFMMLFFNFLIYFKLFSPAAIIIGHILLGVCISSVFLSFIYGLQYNKHVGLIFGVFHFSILSINILFRRFLMLKSFGGFLTKDLHVVLLQINNKTILHFYGYHIPIIFMTILTCSQFCFIKWKQKGKNPK